MEPNYQVQLKIPRPVAEVFDAVLKPEKLSAYFVQTASGPIVEGTTVKWRFAEVPGEHDVAVLDVLKDQRIVLEWGAPDKSRKIRVTITFQPLESGDTMIQISESGWGNTPEDVKSSYGNVGGWMHMMCCLKAYLEYGIIYVPAEPVKPLKLAQPCVPIPTVYNKRNFCLWRNELRSSQVFPLKLCNSFAVSLATITATGSSRANRSTRTWSKSQCSSWWTRLIWNCAILPRPM